MAVRALDVVDIRLQAVQLVLGGESVREVAAQFSTSKTQLYEWVKAYRRDGMEGLLPKSRRPHASPHQLDSEIEDEIVRIRKARPRWGAKKIHAVLIRTGWPVPARSTVHEVLRRRGLVAVQPSRRTPPGGWRRFARTFSNELWQIDGTQHRLANGREFWVVDIVDDATRFLLETRVGPALTGQLAWQAFRAAVSRYGLPAQLLSDNGLQFTGRLRGIEVAFERQVRATGCEPIHSRPYRPTTVGKLERQHRTQNEWCADLPTARSLTEAEQLIESYRQDYNTVRPHEAIGQRTPAEVYQPGTGLELPTVELAPADPYPAGCLRRRVGATGRLTWNHRSFYIDHRWAGIDVGLLRHHGQLRVYYGSAIIDTFVVGDHPNPEGRGTTKINN
jgi:transposase InsO family protein